MMLHLFVLIGREIKKNVFMDSHKNIFLALYFLDCTNFPIISY